MDRCIFRSDPAFLPSWFLRLLLRREHKIYRSIDVDPTWPKPLPNHWLMQGVPVMVTDKDDHIWVFNRPRDINPDESGAATTPPRTDCCKAAPAVLEFDNRWKSSQELGRPGLRARMAGRRDRKTGCRSRTTRSSSIERETSG